MVPAGTWSLSRTTWVAPGPVPKQIKHDQYLLIDKYLIVAIPKPEKPLGDPKSYRPISLLCVPFKILDKLIYARVDPVIDPLLAREQAGFRHGRSTVDQVTLLTQDIEDSFRLKRKQELCLSTSQQPTTLHGTTASPASCCNCCLIDTWSI